MPKDNLTCDDLAQEYDAKGYIVVPDLFTMEEVEEMRAALDEMIEEGKKATENTEIFDLEPSHTLDRPRVRRIKEPFIYHPVYNKMIRKHEMIEVLKALVGPSFRVHQSKINMKSAEYGSPVEWHQDWLFYPHTNDDVLAVGVMLDDMTPDNGAMMMVPGSHKGEVYSHEQDGRFVGAMDPDDCPGIKTAELITGTAGSCSFHHVRTVHGSDLNRSGTDRRLCLYHIAAGDAWDIRGFKKAKNWDGWSSTFIAGEATNRPRMENVPVCLPYPEPLKSGSIYESQTLLRNTYFEKPPAAE